eukprot:TRINITY_DN557_c2_g1_i1.p5 TRINITY_DN557_c2_g1~~TRINITY_DN557_c2_g1_i1.p5  ORF type:complete len:111 (-),score=4.91 TRINITY_DN557_c2_g1_i1:880-1212(-)
MCVVYLGIFTPSTFKFILISFCLQFLIQSKKETANKHYSSVDKQSKKEAACKYYSSVDKQFYQIIQLNINHIYQLIYSFLKKTYIALHSIQSKVATILYQRSCLQILQQC